MEGICKFIPSLTASIPLTASLTSSTRSTPRTTLEVKDGQDISGPSPLRDCVGDENNPGYELEGICNFVPSLTASIPQATSSRTPIPQTTLKVLKESKFEVSPDLNGPSQPLRDCTDSENFPEYEWEGICRVTHGNKKSSKAKRGPAVNDAKESSSTKAEGIVTGKSNLEPAATTVALHKGSANMRGAGMSIVGAELLALTLFFLLAN